jgi:hypothetical protein
MTQFPIITLSHAIEKALAVTPQQQSPSSNKPPAEIEESLFMELAIIGCFLLILFRGFGVMLAIAYACYRFYQSIESYPKE